MPWKLKQNAPEFDCVDGPLAGQKFRRGQVYDDVPLGDKARFDPAEPPPKPPIEKKKDDSEAEIKTISVKETKMNGMQKKPITAV